MKNLRGLGDRCARHSKPRLLAASGMEPFATVTVNTANYTTHDFRKAIGTIKDSTSSQHPLAKRREPLAKREKESKRTMSRPEPKSGSNRK